MIGLPLDRLDWIGVASWLGCWVGYQLLAEWRSLSRPSLAAAMRPYRRAWMHEALERDNRVADAALVGNLMQSATFLGSTTLLVIGGLFAFLGGGLSSAQLVQSLPFALKTSAQLFELKALTLALTLVYAFLRFLWSIRQFNLVVILIGAYPQRRPGAASAGASPASPAEPHDERLALQAARLNELAGINFTQGLRAYYYAVPPLLWLVNPWLLIAGSVAITAITYYMEFRSASVVALTQRPGGAPARTSPR